MTDRLAKLEHSLATGQLYYWDRSLVRCFPLFLLLLIFVQRLKELAGVALR